MELTHLNQIPFNELQSEKIDCLIAACADQIRCHHLAEKFYRHIPKKILVTPDVSKKGYKVPQNLEIFSVYGFSRYDTTGQNESQILGKLLGEICNVSAHQVNVLIDYSCMPKKWYAQIIDTVTRNNYLASRINLFLSYTPKVFEKKAGKPAVDYIGPILFNRDSLKDKKPVSIIASLDNNKDALVEAISKIKPQKLLAFIPHCRHDPEYTSQVKEINKAVLNRLDENSIINYDADRPEEIDMLLTSYCLDERIASEVMILPQGPKTFSLMSMLLSVRYPDIKLWEIILEDTHRKDEGHPAGTPVIVKASFVNEDDPFDD